MSKLIEKRDSSIHGKGVFARRDIAAGTTIIEYKGKRVSHEQANECSHTGDPAAGHTFLFTLNDHWVIDATQSGNVARWINHGCTPNCHALIEEHPIDRRKDKVWIEALTDIRAGEELTYNYQVELEDEDDPEVLAAWTCRCGAPNCCGTMLSRPESAKAA